VIQLLFYLALFELGALFNLALGPRRDGALVGALAFPCGLALWGLSALVAFAAGLPLTPGLLVASLAGESLLFAVIAVARRVRAVLRPLGFTAALFTVGAAVLSTFSAAKLSTDSHHILRLAHLLGQGAPLDETVAAYMSDRGVFTVLSYSAADLIGADFLYALAPVLALSFAMLFAIAGTRMARAAGAAPRAAVLAVGLALAAALTAYLPSYHLVYLHTNQGSAVYLLAFIALVWLAEATGDPAHLRPAFLCLAAFALHRVEAPLFAGLFLVMAIYPSDLPRRAIAIPFAAYTLVVCGWLARIGALAPTDSEFLSRSRALALVVAVAACFLAWPVATRLRRLRRHIPALVALLILAALAAAFARKPDHMISSARALAIDLLDPSLGAWAFTWWAVALALVAALFTPPLAAGRSLFLAAFASAAFTLLLAFGRIPYRVGFGDSANRMFLHYLPLAMLYLIVKLAPHMRGAAPPPRAPAAPP
jgi:hypothetical protein